MLPPPASPAAGVFQINLDASPPFCHAPCTLRVPAGSLAELKAGISAQLALDSSVQFDVLVCDEDFDEFCVRRREHTSLVLFKHTSEIHAHRGVTLRCTRYNRLSWAFARSSRIALYLGANMLQRCAGYAVFLWNVWHAQK